MGSRSSTSGSEPRERGREGRLEETMRIGRLGLSAGERGEGEEGGRSWPAGAGEARGKWAEAGRKEKGEGEKKGFSIFFSKSIFKLIFKMEFEFKLFCSKPHITNENAPA